MAGNLYASPTESDHAPPARPRRPPRRHIPHLADCRPCRRSTPDASEIPGSGGGIVVRSRSPNSQLGRMTVRRSRPEPAMSQSSSFAFNLAARVVIQQPDVLTQRRRLVDRRRLVGGMAVGTRRADVHEPSTAGEPPPRQAFAWPRCRRPETRSIFPSRRPSPRSGRPAKHPNRLIAGARIGEIAVLDLDAPSSQETRSCCQDAQRPDAISLSHQLFDDVAAQKPGGSITRTRLLDSLELIFPCDPGLALLQISQCRQPAS